MGTAGEEAIQALLIHRAALSGQYEITGAVTVPMNGELMANYRDTLRQTSSKSGRGEGCIAFQAGDSAAPARLFWRRRHLFSLTPTSKSGDAEPKRFCFREVELRLCLAARDSQQTAGARSCGCVQRADTQIINSTYLTRRGQQLERRTPDSPRTQPPCYKMHACFCELLLHHARARLHSARPGSIPVLHGIIPFASSSLSIRPLAADWLAIIAFSGQSCLGALQRSCFCAAT